MWRGTQTGRMKSTLTLLCAGALLVPPAFAQSPAPSPKAEGAKPGAVSPVTSSTAPSPAAGEPSEEEMMKMMMELSKLNENHKLLADLVGEWDYTVKYWFDPSAPPNESKGVAVRKPIMDGRYFSMDVDGKMEMPGPDGKMQKLDFKGKSIEGYDNVKKKFFGIWLDNMSTGPMIAYGTYDSSAKAWTYTGTMEMMPGQETKFREVVKVLSPDEHVFEFYEDRGGKEVKTMEITYKRKK